MLLRGCAPGSVYLRSMPQRGIFRRHFLRFIASSPLYGWVPDASMPRPQLGDVLNVMELEPLAHEVVAPAHWGYLSTGVDDDLTLLRNREAMSHYELRARVLSRMMKK